MAGQATVAKLNIQLGVGTAGVTSGINQTVPLLQNFKQRIDSLGGGAAGGSNNLASAFRGANSAVSLLKGNLSGVASLMPQLTAGALGIAAAYQAAKFAAWGIKLAAGQDSEFQQKWKQFKDEIADLALIIGNYLLPPLKEWLGVGIAIIRAVKGGAAAPGTHGRLTDPAGTHRQQQEAAQKALALEKQKTEEMEKQARLITESINKQNEAWVSLGKRITEEMRTPGEVLSQRVGELNFLANRGLITFDTYSRAINQAADDFASLGEKTRQLQRTQRVDVAALDRNSVEGFAAVRSGVDVWNEIKSIEREQLEVHKAANRKREEILRAIREGGLRVREVTF